MRTPAGSVVLVELDTMQERTARAAGAVPRTEAGEVIAEDVRVAIAAAALEWGNKRSFPEVRDGRGPHPAFPGPRGVGEGARRDDRARGRRDPGPGACARDARRARRGVAGDRARRTRRGADACRGPARRGSRSAAGGAPLFSGIDGPGVRDPARRRSGTADPRAGRGRVRCLGPAFRHDPDDDVLDSCHPLEDSPVQAQAEAIGRDQSGDDGFAESPARLDHDLVGAVERVPREEDAGAIGGHHFPLSSTLLRIIVPDCATVLRCAWLPDT
jgi:hypothetical protein